MTLTATDLFCGAGGSSLGARTAGVEPRQPHAHRRHHAMTTTDLCRHGDHPACSEIGEQ